MDSKIIDGRKWAKVHEQELKEKIIHLNKKPSGVNILIGEDPSSVLYTQLKEKKAQSLGIDFQTVILPARSDFDQVADYIQKLIQPDGIMVQLPLPPEFLKEHTTEELLVNIDPQKDIDGLTGKGPFLPAAVSAVLMIIDDENIEVAGKKVAVLGASDLVGKPAGEELKKMGGEVEVYDSKTENLKGKILTADIVVSATGVPHLVKSDWVKEGVVVIDVGAEKVDGKLLGDVDFDSVYPKASKITPVPGGVGPLTVIALMENVVQLATDKER